MVLKKHQVPYVKNENTELRDFKYLDQVYIDGMKLTARLEFKLFHSQEIWYKPQFKFWIKEYSDAVEGTQVLDSSLKELSNIP